MRLAMVSRPLADTDLRLARQMGMSDVVSTVPGVTMAPEREQGPALKYEDLLAMRQQVEAAGLRLSVIEGYQLSDRITLGMPGRDDDLARVCESITNMGRAGIPIYCYNFMAVFNWLRTSTDIVGRGGALVTRFDAGQLVDGPVPQCPPRPGVVQVGHGYGGPGIHAGRPACHPDARRGRF